MTLSSATPSRQGIVDQGFWILAGTILGSSIAFIDTTVVSVALPVLQRELQATVADAQWVVEGYTLFLASLLLVGGTLGDLYGRRRIYIIGTVIFTLASMWCGLAPNIGQLIAARLVQGIGGALLTPNSLAIISALFKDNERGKAIGTWSAFTAITSLLGPVIGGVLIQIASWRLVFFINLPLAVIVIAIMYWKVPENRDETRSPDHLDWAGATLATLGLGGITYALIRSSLTSLRDGQVILTGIIGIGLFVAFVLVERRIRYPMLPMRVFESRTFVGANLLTFLLYGALGGTFFFLPFLLIQVKHYSTIAAGAVSLPSSLLLFALSRWSGSLVDRFGARLPLLIGPSIVAVGYLLFTRAPQNGSYWFVLFPASVVVGLGMAITVAPLTTTVMSAISGNYAGVASGVNNAVARAAGLIAIAVLGIVVSGVFANALTANLATLHLPASLHDAVLVQRTRLAAIDIPSSASSIQRTQITAAIDTAFATAFRVAMLIGAGMALLSAVLGAMFINGKHVVQRAQHV